MWIQNKMWMYNVDTKHNMDVYVDTKHNVDVYVDTKQNVDV